MHSILTMSNIDDIIKDVMNNSPDRDTRLMCLAILNLNDRINKINTKLNVLMWLLSSILFLLIINVIKI